MRVLVIGQGLAGTLFSHVALQRGWDCHVIDAGLPSASSVAAGMFNPMSFRRVVEVWDAQAHLDALKATMDDFSAILDAPFLHPLSIRKRLANADYAAIWNEKCADCPWISPVQFQDGEANYGTVTGGGWVNLQSLIPLWREHLNDSGRFEKRTFDVSESATEWDVVVDCRGLAMRDAPAGIPLDLRANRGEILTVEHDSESHASPVPQNLILNFGKWTLPIAPNLWRLGASYEWHREDFASTPETAAFLHDALESELESPSKLKTILHQVGLRPVSRDRRPIVGPMPGRPGWFVFNGLGTRGVLIGPKWAQNLANQIEGASETPALVDPNRLKF